MVEALYRKYRPQVFEDVVGQDTIERTLQNAIKQDKVSHAYLFCGPRGTGKTTTARLLAKALLCENGPTATPDGTCEDCELIARGEHPDVYELDAASRTGVENVREEIIGRVQFAPTRGRRKIYIIDEVHMLSTAAFNALLKTLEEPPAHVVFILCTTDPQKVPETIHSRCQRFDFRRISHEAIVSRLGAICMAEQVQFEGEALDVIAHRAQGGMRNALTALEQLIAYEGGNVTLSGAESLLGSISSSDMVRILSAVGSRDAAACFVWVSEFLETGADLAQFTRDFAARIRDLYVLSIAGQSVSLEIDELTRQELSSVASLFGPDRLAYMMGVLGDVLVELKTSTNPRLTFEIALTRMIRPQTDLTLESLAARIEALEAGGYVPAVSAAAPAIGAQVGVTQPQAAAAQVGDVQAQSAQADAGQPQAADVQVIGAQVASVQVGDAAQTQAARVAQTQEAQPATQAAENAPQVRKSSVSASSGTALDLSNPATLQRFWQKVLACVKKEKAAYHVLLINSKPEYRAQSNSLVVMFPAESDFAYKAFQKPEANEVLERSLTAVYGAPLSFSYEQLTAQNASRTQAQSVQVQSAQTPSSQAQSAQTSSSYVSAVSNVSASNNGATSNSASTSSNAFAYDDEDRVPLDAYEAYASTQDAAPRQQKANPQRAAETAKVAETTEVAGAAHFSSASVREVKPQPECEDTSQSHLYAQPASQGGVEAATKEAATEQRGEVSAQPSEASDQELDALKDALSLFGDGVTLEEC